MLSASKETRAIRIDDSGEIDGLPVSMQVYQAVYRSITGKTENISRKYTNAFEVNFDDITQLGCKLTQFLEQYNVSEVNHSITVFYSGSTKEQFSSLERFGLYNSSNASPTERIILEFNFLIVLPKVKTPQPYNVQIELTSGLALLHRHKNDFPKHIPFGFLVKAIQLETAEVEVKYVDYIVARSILDLVNEWSESLKKNEYSKTLKKFQDNSHHVHTLFKYIFSVIFLVIVIDYSNRFLSDTITNTIHLFTYSVISFAVLFCAYKSGNYIGFRVERAIDAIRTTGFSAIRINKGDDVLIDNFSKQISKSKSSFVREIIIWIFGIIVSIVGKLII